MSSAGHEWFLTRLNRRYKTPAFISQRKVVAMSFNEEWDKADKVARKMKRQFSGCEWMSGVGTQGGRPVTLVVYVLSDDHPELNGHATYFGVPFTIHNIVESGRIHREKILQEQLDSLP